MPTKTKKNIFLNNFCYRPITPAFPVSSTPYFNQSGSSNTLPPKAAILFFFLFLPQNDEVVKDSNEIILDMVIWSVKLVFFYRLDQHSG